MAPRRKTPKEEQQPPFDERMQAAVSALEGLGGETAIYDRDALLGAHTVVTETAHQGFARKEIDQPKSIEAKLEATRLAVEIAEKNGDKVTAMALGQLAQTLETLLSVIKPNETAPTPASTSKSQTSSAKQ